MIFYLTDSLVVLETDPSFNDIRKAVRNLATASCEGKHYVLGDLDALEYFREVFKPANDDVSKLFDTLSQNYPTQIIPSDVIVYFEIVNSDTYVKKQNDDQEIIQVPYKDFIDSSSAQATVLIGEDVEYDCWFYKYIKNWYLKVKGLNVSCKYFDRHGGGGRMKTVIESCYTQKETSLCFVDTDERFPGQPVNNNSTYRKCMSARKGVRNGVYPLTVHEIENLLPMNYIDQLQYEGEHRDRKIVFDVLKNSNQSEMVLQFFDFKDGLKKYVEYKDTDSFINFAKTVCEINPIVMGGMTFDEYYSSKGDNELLYPGLMGRILKHTIDLIKNNATLQAPVLLSFQDAEWRRIGRLMLSYGFARNVEGISN